MTVIELIKRLQDMPHNAEVLAIEGDGSDTRQPEPEMVWNDFAENYLVVL